MSRFWLPIASVSLCWLSPLAVGLAQTPGETPATKENIEAALKNTMAAAKEYEVRVGEGDMEKLLELKKESLLKWSNPGASDIQGNLFLWTHEGRPLLIASFHQWFLPKKKMEHEFHSLAEESLRAKYHGDVVWKTSEAGLKFVDVPDAAVPAAVEMQRLLQLKQLAKDFTGAGKYRKDPNDTELRFLPHPIYSYALPKQGIFSGGVFAFVRGTGTDPEIILQIEARGKDVASARWQFGAARMTNNAVLRLRYQNKEVWQAEQLNWDDVNKLHKRAYTAFDFEENVVP